MKSSSLLPILILVGCAGLFAWAAMGPTNDNPDQNAKDAPGLTKKTPDGPPATPPITEPIGTAPQGMVWIPGGTFTMGTDFDALSGKENPDKIKPDEYPAHEVTVDGFWIDITEVTNTQFAKFIEATKYVTSAEIVPKREDFIGIIDDISIIPEENLVAGSLIFKKDFDRENFSKDNQGWEYQAWEYKANADWRHPTGPESSIKDRMDHPVVNVTYADCIAYCKWAGKRLPREAEWEYASRGGVADDKYSWGNELIPDGKYMCNYWQGDFPLDRKNLDGFLETSPVKSYPANRYGLYDMSGNIWEWV
ncbi:MAG: formylglycine-generating enzyme family protein, partial [Planctomycetaceae bacterium]|nr:formylglycine-generating enzyme family protein [Planctomycetaceae bacterium]